MDTGDRLLTPGEVAALFRVDPKTVTRWAAAGRIGSIRTPGGHRRFRESEVRALLEGEGMLDETDEDLAARPPNAGPSTAGAMGSAAASNMGNPGNPAGGGNVDPTNNPAAVAAPVPGNNPTPDGGPGPTSSGVF